MPMIARYCDYNAPVSEIALSLDEYGAVAITGLVAQEWLETARADVLSRFTRAGKSNQYVFEPGAIAGSPAHQLINNPHVQALLEGLAATRRPHSIGPHVTASALNILTGASSNPGQFHYDANTVTMVVPLFIPTAGPDTSGDLAIFPNRRPFRRSVVANIFEKALTQNRFHSAHAMRSVRREPAAHTLAMEPGNAYLFWGYRTYHGTLPCKHEDLRATLLLHCGNPHDGSRMLEAAKWLSRKVKPLPPQHFVVDGQQEGLSEQRSI